MSQDDHAPRVVTEMQTEFRGFRRATTAGCTAMRQDVELIEGLGTDEGR